MKIQPLPQGAPPLVVEPGETSAPPPAPEARLPGLDLQPGKTRPQPTDMTRALEPETNPLSQSRGPTQSFESALARYVQRNPGSTLVPTKGRTAYSARTKWSNVDTSDVIEWPSMAVLNERFAYLRDLRFMKSPGRPEFLRRISWLYPDDGCFARAGMMTHLLRKAGLELPNRVFIFGRLRVQTPNHQRGRVQWWYHTAPVVQVDGTVYVLDPALEPAHPLPLEEWSRRQTRSLGSIKISVCAADAYEPSSNCDAPQNQSERARRNQTGYLKEEWSRQRTLRRDPNKVLGDAPPWQTTPLQ